MRIAIPVSQGKLSAHFGHCENYLLIDVDMAEKRILDRTTATPPAHEPGVLPAWLADLGAQVIVAGGMGSRAQQLFESRGVKVVVGAPTLDPDSLARAWMAGELGDGTNACDH